MHRTLAAIAATAFALTAFSADAAVRCRNNQGQIITCPTPPPSTATTAHRRQCTAGHKICGLSCVPVNKVCNKRPGQP
jgi:hypothetical protein